MTCSHPEPHPALTTAGVRACAACADLIERAALLTADRVTFYLSEDGRRLTGWLGNDLGAVTVTSTKPNPAGWISRSTSYVNVVDLYGNRWYGAGPGPGMSINLRRRKAPA